MLRAESFGSQEEDVTQCPSRVGEGRERLVALELCHGDGSCVSGADWTGARGA